MFLNGVIIKTKRMHKNITIHSIQFLEYEYEPTDKYEDYLAHGARPKNHATNKRNLFDDSNSEDRKILKSVRMYLARSR
jgi:hypothetical protein